MTKLVKKYTDLNGRPWFVQVVKQGDSYGLDDCLMHEEEAPSVEFWDGQQDPEKFGPIGQFTGGRYYMKTILEHEEGYGLNLNGGVPVWSIDGPTMTAIKRDLNVINSYL